MASQNQSVKEAGLMLGSGAIVFLLHMHVRLWGNRVTFIFWGIAIDIVFFDLISQFYSWLSVVHLSLLYLSLAHSFRDSVHGQLVALGPMVE